MVRKLGALLRRRYGRLARSNRERTATNGRCSGFVVSLLKGQGGSPWRMIKDTLRSGSATLCAILPSVPHVTDRYANNRAEVFHEPRRERERRMRRFKSPGQAQRFLCVHAMAGNLFGWGVT
jgi:putative transposase